MQDIFIPLYSAIGSPGFYVLAIFAMAGGVIHFRGKERHSFTRQLTSYTTFLAPINVLMYAFSKVPNRAYLDPSDFPELQLLRDNWETIREEAQTLYQENHIRISDGVNDVGFYSLFKKGWKRFYLTWYGRTLPSAEQSCPQTLALIRQIPSIKAAMFTSLPPGAKLMKHRDPYAGSLRYHLGLFTPNHDQCRLIVDQEVYSWRDGQDVLFDETFIHYAENRTDQPRVILFCDVRRPMRNRFMQWLADVIGAGLGAATAARNTPDEALGFLNRLFGRVYVLRELLKKLKVKSQVGYYGLKYLIVALLLYWLLF